LIKILDKGYKLVVTIPEGIRTGFFDIDF